MAADVMWALGDGGGDDVSGAKGGEERLSAKGWRRNQRRLMVTAGVNMARHFACAHIDAARYL